MTVRKIIGFLHLWLGLASGLVVFLIAVSGCAYVFVDELKPVVYHDRLFVVPENKPKLPVSQLLAIAQKKLGDDKVITRIEVPNAPDRSIAFRSQKTNPEGLTHWDYFEYYYRVYVNPYSGAVIKVEDTKNEFFQLALSLHMRMLFGEEIGHYVVGYSVLAFALILISGLVLWFPKWKKKINVRDNFKLKWNAKRKRLNYDLHKVLGFYAFLVLFLTALTGLIWVFEWAEDSMRFLANGESIEKAKPMKSDTVLKGESALDIAYFKAVNNKPDAVSYLILLPAKPDATINILTYLKDWNKFDRNVASFDRYSGKLLKETSFDDLNNGDKLYQLNFDLHTGAYMGLFGKILSFLAALVCASLPVTGFYIWWGKKSKQKKEKRKIAVVG